MGKYNPNAPQILGQEWVPIRENPLTLTPAVNLLEVGHTFSLTSSQVVQTARFYVGEYASGDPAGQVVLASVYPHGYEPYTGPIRSVLVPCSLGTVTAGSVTLVGASTIAQALADPSDASYVLYNANPVTLMQLRFETESYLPMLIGKRILGVDFLYVNFIDNSTDPAVTQSAAIGSSTSTPTAIGIGTMTATNDPSSFFNLKIGRIKVGEVDYYWNAPISSSPVEVLPWSPNRLRAFDNSSGLTDRMLLIDVTSITANQTVIFDYAALEIFFCEEQRIMWGGRRYTSTNPYVFGANQIYLRNLADAFNSTLSVGTYDLVISSANLTPGNQVAYPELNQVQQLYPIVSHPAVRTIRPFPIDDTALGQTFSNEYTTLIPQLSLHTSGGPVTDVHVYGRQAVAQVYGSVTATQEILDSAAGSSQSYPWVRYYARRFGNTTTPLKLTSPTLSGSSASITPSEFDALDEIIDGWKEVTLRFSSAPSMGSGTNPQWVWSASGENLGSRWEVLGAFAPAISGAPGNLLNLVPSPHQLSLATYGAPASGSNINLGWVPGYAPPVSATTDDQTADAVLMFARDMPTITGFTVSVGTQDVTGIGLNCGIDPCCIPTDILYTNISWGLPTATINISDTFTRAATGWGSTTSGQAYTDSGGTVEGNYVTTGSQGTHILDSVNVVRHSTLAGSITNSHQRVKVTNNVTIAGASIRARIIGHFSNTSNYDYVDFRYSTVNSQMELVIGTNVAGTPTNQTNVAVGAVVAGQQWYLDVDFSDTIIRAKAWPVGNAEPSEYQATGTAAFIVGGVGLGSIRSTGNTNADAVISFDDYTVGPSTWDFGYFELQRKDSITPDWATIMKMTAPSGTSFKDYEARVGLQSDYRIRAVDLYDFPGPWSSTVSLTIPAPGASGGCISTGHILIFTSNEVQDGSVNLAYSSVWEQGRTVEEAFEFPEARFVQLQAMYNRDFFTAFRPMERGGEQFSRTVLVQAAAISPETLADFTSLRDMAWSDTSYICVRDEDGNRWFATVLVPSGRVLRDRRLYLAPVEIIEVTDTPSQVNP